MDSQPVSEAREVSYQFEKYLDVWTIGTVFVWLGMAKGLQRGAML